MKWFVFVLTVGNFFEVIAGIVNLAHSAPVTTEARIFTAVTALIVGVWGASLLGEMKGEANERQ